MGGWSEYDGDVLVLVVVLQLMVLKAKERFHER